jgi:hypothetical protein
MLKEINIVRFYKISHNGKVAAKDDLGSLLPNGQLSVVTLFIAIYFFSNAVGQTTRILLTQYYSMKQLFISI